MQTEPPLHRPRRWRLLVLCGILFELFLLALCFLLPEGSPLAAEVRNYGFLIHSPLLWMLNNSANSYLLPSSLFWLLSFFFCMALFWAFLFNLAWHVWAWVQARVKISRRQKLIAGCGIGFVGAIVLALAIIAALPQTAIPFTASPEVKSAVDSNTAFALDLYQKLKEQPGNLSF